MVQYNSNKNYRNEHLFFLQDIIILFEVTMKDYLLLQENLNSQIFLVSVCNYLMTRCLLSDSKSRTGGKIWRNWVKKNRKEVGWGGKKLLLNKKSFIQFFFFLNFYGKSRELEIFNFFICIDYVVSITFSPTWQGSFQIIVFILFKKNMTSYSPHPAPFLNRELNKELNE